MTSSDASWLTVAIPGALALTTTTVRLDKPVRSAGGATDLAAGPHSIFPPIGD